MGTFSITRAFIALMIEAERTYETSVYDETTWRNIPESSNLFSLQ
jgi:hypothetical protein